MKGSKTTTKNRFAKKNGFNIPNNYLYIKYKI